MWLRGDPQAGPRCEFRQGAAVEEEALRPQFGTFDAQHSNGFGASVGRHGAVLQLLAVAVGHCNEAVLGEAEMLLLAGRVVDESDEFHGVDLAGESTKANSGNLVPAAADPSWLSEVTDTEPQALTSCSW